MNVSDTEVTPRSGSGRVAARARLRQYGICGWVSPAEVEKRDELCV
jgi:hypothetical protein